MHTARVFVFVTTILLLAGCSTAPITFEESLQLDRATRNDVRDWDKEIRYRVGFQYANTARNLIDQPQIEVPPDRSMDFEVPFAIWDFSRGENLGGTMGFLSWFNAGLSEESRYGHYYNQSLSYMVHPNTHYFTFDESDAPATPEAVHQLWDEAHALFRSIYNANGQCYVFGFNPKDQYRRTFSKDVPGRYKIVAYRCPHPLFSDQEYSVVVSAWAETFPGVRVMASVQSQCYTKPPRGQKFLDVRACGISQANRQRDLIPTGGVDWLELITTPLEDNPHLFVVIARTDGFERRLPAPETTPGYQEFLQSRPYPAE